MRKTCSDGGGCYIVYFAVALLTILFMLYFISRDDKKCNTRLRTEKEILDCKLLYERGRSSYDNYCRKPICESN